MDLSRIHNRLNHNLNGVETAASGPESKYAALDRLVTDLIEMPGAKVKTISTAVRGISEFLASSSFMGSFPEGKMLVRATYHKLGNLELAMNGMRWLTKFYFKDIVEGFSTVYRIHAIVDGRKLKVNSPYTFVPHKPILSWSILKEPDVAARETEEGNTDYILKFVPKQPNIVWSYKFVEWSPVLFKYKKDNLNTLRENPEVYKIFTDLCYLSEAMWADEKEVTVFHGQSKFKAQVIKEIKE